MCRRGARRALRRVAGLWGTCVLATLVVGTGGNDAALPNATLQKLLFEEPNRHLDELAQISDDSTGRLSRTFMSPAHVRSADLIREWMLQAGMSRVWVDAVGNVRGRLEPRHEEQREQPALLMGSHYDTVLDAGKYDGSLGIVVALAAAKTLVVGAACEEAAGQLPTELGELCAGGEGKRGEVDLQPWVEGGWRPSILYPVEVVAFSDEEGVRFQTTFFGSRALAGTLLGLGALQARDTEGATVQQVLQQHGLMGGEAEVAALALSRERVRGFVEVHLEQGPVLQRKGVALGVVARIAGQTRLLVEVSGEQGHAGTVPMELRRDSLAAAAEAISAIEALCVSAAAAAPAAQLVCTVGQLTVWPGASNVIPSAANFTVDIRSGIDAARANAVRATHDAVRQLCERRRVDCQVHLRHAADAVDCSPDLQCRLSAAVAASIPTASMLQQGAAGAAPPTSPPARPNQAGLEAMSCALPGEESVPVLVSGAGHDALALAPLTGIAMLFVRCRNGVSHSPLEYVAPGDVAAAAAALWRFLRADLPVPGVS